MKALNESSYRPAIDGLRALAVLAVIIHHFNGDLVPSGFLGVDLFFVISGYVITQSLWTRPRNSLKDLLLGFYSRRVKRLVPALVVCVAITGVAAMLFNPEPQVSILTGVSALFGASNIYLFWHATDYFGASAELNFFTQTWTLGVEEQFYLAFPFVLWLTGFTRQSANNGKFLLLALGLLSLLSLLAYLHVVGRNPSAGYFLMPYRFWEIGAGCLLFLTIHQYPSVGRLACRINPAIPLVLICAVLFFPLSVQVASTVATVGLALVLVGSVRPDTLAHRLLTIQPMVYLGLISYSLYLWHWSVLVISRWTLGIYLWSAPIQLALIFLLAAVSYQYVERPLRHKKWSSRQVFDVVYALSALSVVAFVLFVSSGYFREKLYFGHGKPIQFAHTESEVLKKAWASPEHLDAMENAANNGMDCVMTPQYLPGEYYRPAPVVDESFLFKCLHTSRNKVVSVGDSFAGNYGMHLAYAAELMGYDSASIIGYGCPYPLNITKIGRRAKKSCDIDPEILQDAIIQALNPGDILVFSLFFSNNLYVRLTDNLSESVLSIYDDEIANFSKRVRSKGASLLVIGTSAIFDTSEACQHPAWFNAIQRTDGRCDAIDMKYNLANRFAVKHNEHLQHLAQVSPNQFSFMDPISILCTSDRQSCPVVVDGVHQMFDNFHLNSAAMDTLYGHLFAELMALSNTQD